MTHAPEWVGALQVLFLFATVVLNVLWQDVPNLEGLPRRAQFAARVRVHPRLFVANLLCATAATVCGILFYF